VPYFWVMAALLTTPPRVDGPRSTHHPRAASLCLETRALGAASTSCCSGSRKLRAGVLLAVGRLRQLRDAAVGAEHFVRPAGLGRTKCTCAATKGNERLSPDLM
jgi:hypothetical protein